MVVYGEQFSAGVQFMDNSTKRFISELNKLSDAMKNGEGRQYIIFVVDYLKDYCETHLAFENKVMAQYDFFDQVKHQSLHDEFREEILVILKKYEESGSDHSMPLTVQRMMSLWLSKHIGKQDKVLGDFLLTKLSQKSKS